jgi:hypothetical protein
VWPQLKPLSADDAASPEHEILSILANRRFQATFEADKLRNDRGNHQRPLANLRGEELPMLKTLTLAAALAGATLLAAPASAAPISAAPTAALALADGGKDLVQTVQYRRYGGYRGGPRYGYRGGYRGGRGGAIAGGIAAGALGALAAGALLAPGPVYGGPVYVEPAPVYVAPRAYGYGASDVDAVAYCSRKFRSYDPETGTYIASGGVVRACP